jgi:hypothetical protein
MLRMMYQSPDEASFIRKDENGGIEFMARFFGKSLEHALL